MSPSARLRSLVLPPPRSGAVLPEEVLGERWKAAARCVCWGVEGGGAEARGGLRGGWSGDLEGFWERLDLGRDTAGPSFQPTDTPGPKPVQLRSHSSAFTPRKKQRNVYFCRFGGVIEVYSSLLAPPTKVR